MVMAIIHRTVYKFLVPARSFGVTGVQVPSGIVLTCVDPSLSTPQYVYSASLEALLEAADGKRDVDLKAGPVAQTGDPPYLREADNCSRFNVVISMFAGRGSDIKSWETCFETRGHRIHMVQAIGHT